jgi:hypothetical protein
LAQDPAAGGGPSLRAARELAAQGSRRRRLAGELTGDGQTGLPCTIRDGESTELKRRARGTHLGARNRGRGVGEGDRGGAADCGGELRGGDAAGQGKGKEVVREEQGVWRTFYKVEEKGEGRARRWRRGRWPAAIKAQRASVGRRFREGKR